MAAGWRLPNLWDAVAFVCVIGALVGVGHVAEGTLTRIDAPGATEISLDPWQPAGTTRCAPRCACSPPWPPRCCSPSPTRTAAAKSRRAALVLVPILDMLQSVPILGFLTFTVVFFMSLFPGQVLGAGTGGDLRDLHQPGLEHGVQHVPVADTVPADLTEARRSFHLTAWQRFWRLEVPFAMPGLVWNTMMSMSGGWFFVVRRRRSSVGDNT